MANKGDEEWLCETWESSRYNREGRRWTAEHWLHHGCNASLAEISTCFHFVAISWPPCPHLGHQQPGQCLQQRAAERQNIVSLSIALVLYYLDNMCSMLLCSPKISKPELRDVCVVGGCYKGGLWPEWMASPTLSGQPQVARKHELSNPRRLLKLSKLWNWMLEARHAEHAAILKTLRSATLCPFTTLVTRMT